MRNSLGGQLPTDLYTRLSRYPTLAGVVVGLLGGLGLLALGIGVRDTWKERVATKWPQVPGVITGSEVRVTCGGRGGCSRLPDILYRYDVDGEQLSSDRVTFGGVMLDWSTPEADQVVARYPVGTSVVVHYDPRNHQEALLEPGRYLGSLMVCGLGAFLIGAPYANYRRTLATTPKAVPGLAA